MNKSTAWKTQTRAAVQMLNSKNPPNNILSMLQLISDRCPAPDPAELIKMQNHPLCQFPSGLPTEPFVWALPTSVQCKTKEQTPTFKSLTLTKLILTGNSNFLHLHSYMQNTYTSIYILWMHRIPLGASSDLSETLEWCSSLTKHRIWLAELTELTVHLL